MAEHIAGVPLPAASCSRKAYRYAIVPKPTAAPKFLSLVGNSECGQIGHSEPPTTYLKAHELISSPSTQSEDACQLLSPAFAVLKRCNKEMTQSDFQKTDTLPFHSFLEGTTATGHRVCHSTCLQTNSKPGDQVLFPAVLWDRGPLVPFCETQKQTDRGSLD